MFGKGKDIYRTKALDRLSTPDAVDQLIHAVRPRDWLVLLAAGLLIAMLLGWSVWGTVPTAVNARGVLIHPRTVVDCQTVSAGRLETLAVHAGDYVRKGDVFGRIDQSDILKRLQEDRNILVNLRQQDGIKAALQERQTTLQDLQIQTERNFIELQSDTFRKSLQDAETIAPLLKTRLDGLRALRDEGLIAGVSAELLQVEQSSLENATKMADMRARLKQLDGQLKALETRQAQTELDTVESSTSRKNQMRELEARIALAELQLNRSGEIRCEHAGRIVEVTAAAGQFLPAGTRIATIQIDDTSGALVAVSYLNVGDGKKIQPGMVIQVTPDSVERQRFGGVVGVVDSVSDLPVTREAATLLIGNPATVDTLMPNGPFIQVTAKLQPDTSTFSGYKWSSSAGPEMKLSAGVTATSRVTVEGRAPITYVLPFLRSLSGTD
jgi:HlyD family secretion protein